MCGVNYSFLLFPPSPSPALFIIFFLEPELSWTHLTLPRCLFWKSRPFCVFSDSGMVLWNLSLFPCKGSLGWKSNCSQFSTARHTQTEIEGFGTKHGCEWVSEWVSDSRSEWRSLSHVQLFVTPWTVAHQALLSMDFFRQEYWNGWPFPPPEDLPDSGVKSGSLALWADSLPPVSKLRA